MAGRRDTRRKSTEESARKPRFHVVPPAIHRGAAETIDRIGILLEHEDQEGVLLWRLVRDVELWSAASPAEREHLFAAGAGTVRTLRLRASTVPTDVRIQLRRLIRSLAAPAKASAGEVAATCAYVAEWAREIEARETALAFAQAAALASDDGAHALLTGRCAEEANQRERARTWYVRTVGLARRARDWQSYARSFLELGRMAEQDGTPARARRLYLRAFRTSCRKRFPAEHGRAAAALFRLARDAGDYESASRYARIATRALLRSDARTAGLVLLLAEHWIEHGNARAALRLLDHREGIDSLVSPARAAGAVLRVRAWIAAGDLGMAKEAWASAFALLRSAPDDEQDTEGAAAALLALAKCAAVLDDLRAIERAGCAALARATAEEYPRIHCDLVKLAGGRLDFGTMPSNAK